MIDFKKLEFAHSLSQIIAKHPEWASAGIEAIQQGFDEAVKKWQHDQSKMAALLLLFYLKDKTGYQIEKDDKLRTIEFLSKYFDMETFGQESALRFVENLKR